MEVNSASYASTVNTADAYTGANAAQTTQAAAQNENEANNDVSTAAVYEKEDSSPKKYKVDKKSVQSMIEESNRQVQSFKKLIDTILRKQGDKANQAGGFGGKGEIGYITIDEETRRKAQEDISEDGYYGVEQTSTRILDFAKAISGGDPSKIEELKKAVEQGFKEAEKMWGGKLPDISQRTYDAVMKGFEDWANESKTAEVK